MTRRTITALYDRYEDAARAVRALEMAGLSHGDISIVANNQGDRHSGHVSRPSDVDRVNKPEADALEGAGAGATIGTVLGGGAGLLAGLGLLAIPGLGPVVAAGWLAATLTGAGVGAAAGGLVGSLAGVGVSAEDAEVMAEGVRRGGTLVTVRAEGAAADRAEQILEDHGAVDIDERAEGWRTEGWTGPARAPGPGGVGAADEIGSTAIGAAASTTTGLGTSGLGATDRLASEGDRDEAAARRRRVRSYTAADI